MIDAARRRRPRSRTNGGRSLERRRTTPPAQFYHVIDHQPLPLPGLRRPAGQQHRLHAEPARSTGLEFADFYDAGGGESGYIAVGPTIPTSSSRGATAAC